MSENSSQLGLYVLHLRLYVFRFLCLAALACTVILNFSALTFSQDNLPERAENSENESKSQSEQSVLVPATKSEEASASQAVDEQAQEKTTKGKKPTDKKPPADGLAVENPNAKTPAPKQQFKLARGLHAWARFEPGAWRELEIVTETFDESGNVASRNVTLQKEKLMQVDNGKYVLNVQATVDLGGKKIVGDWKTRILNLATDHAETVTETRRLEDGSFLLAGQTVACQVWEICYRDGTRKLYDRIHFSAQQFPFILSRETFIDHEKPIVADAAVMLPEKPDTTEQVIAVTVPVLPYRLGDQFLGCSNLLTYRLRSKGDSHRSAVVNETVPGGVVEIRSLDYGTEGAIVRWSITKLLGYGSGPPTEKKEIAGDQASVEKTTAEEEISGEASSEESAVDATSADEPPSEEGAAQRKGRRRRRTRKILPKRAARAAEKQDVPADSVSSVKLQVF